MVDIDTKELLRRLQGLKENKLRERILLPLLEKSNFDYVEVRHGIYEKGKDVLCVRSDELNELDVLVVAISRVKLSGKASAKGHLHGILNQLSQCLEEPIKLRDGTERYANRIWLVTPYPLTGPALEASFAKLVKSAVNRIRIVDGLKLISILYEKAPELLVQLGDKKTTYAKRLKDEIVLMHEASAFRLREKLSLLPLYINLDVSVLPNLMFRILSGEMQPHTYRQVPVPARHVKSWLTFGSHAEKVLGVNPIKLWKGPKGPTGRRELASQTGQMAVFKLNAAAFHRGIVRKSLERISRIKDPRDRSAEAIGEALREFSLFCNQVDSFTGHEAAWKLLTRAPKDRNSTVPIDRLQVNVDELLASRLNFQVLGDAGSGKTTLLRVLANKEASVRNGRLPVYVSLSTISPRDSILSLIEKSCEQFGLPISRNSLIKTVESGKLLLLLDGIDEASARIPSVGEKISQFALQFKSIQIIVTTRPWAALGERKLFFPVRLLPFTQDQITLFFMKWFGDQQMHAREIVAHLDSNPELYNIVSTPLVATIFAVVKSFGGTLPTSLQEVYEERLRLLLHDWDAARGISRDEFSVSDKRFFLRKLAWELHVKSTRTLSWEALLKLAKSTLGEIRTEALAERFANELIQHNNVLFQEPNGEWGLGHLQYQEYLAALEAKENPRCRLATFLGNGWWSNVIRMYAQMTRDVSALVYDSIRRRALRRNLSTLYEVLQLAPNTEEKARGYVEKEWDIGHIEGPYTDPVLRMLDTYTALHMRREQVEALKEDAPEK